jgi:hypothetical protein
MERDRVELTLDAWCALNVAELRALLGDAARSDLSSIPGVEEVEIEAGSVGREYDLTLAVRTDTGVLRAPLWSHARAMVFHDRSVHPANRSNFAPHAALDEAIARIRERLEVPFALESRGLVITISPEPGVERTWTADQSRFRKRTAVTREDRVIDPPAEMDVRDLLAHFYDGPSLRLVADDGAPFLLPGSDGAEGPLISLCQSCRHWSDGSLPECPECGSAVDTIIAARPPRR